MLISKNFLTREASYKSCASAAKLREGGPILNRGTKTIVQHRVAATSVHNSSSALNVAGLQQLNRP
jgi:hypothetical protein